MRPTFLTPASIYGGNKNYRHRKNNEQEVSSSYRPSSIFGHYWTGTGVRRGTPVPNPGASIRNPRITGTKRHRLTSTVSRGSLRAPERKSSIGSPHSSHLTLHDVQSVAGPAFENVQPVDNACTKLTPEALVSSSNMSPTDSSGPPPLTLMLPKWVDSSDPHTPHMTLAHGGNNSRLSFDASSDRSSAVRTPGMNRHRYFRRGGGASSRGRNKQVTNVPPNMSLCGTPVAPGQSRSPSLTPPSTHSRALSHVNLLRGRRPSQDTVMSHGTGPSLGKKSSLFSAASSPARKISRLLQLSPLGQWVQYNGISMDTECCPICYEKIALSDCVKLENCRTHCFCKRCMAHFLRGRILEGRVRDLRCPMYGEYACQASTTMDDLEALLDAETMKKYHRFKAQQEDPTLRECPNCLLLVQPQLVEDNPDQIIPEMVCERRCVIFCYYHSLVHAGRTCDEYSREQAKFDKMEEKFLSGEGKACPVCGIKTEKLSGCNEMACPCCNKNWCFVCEQTIGKHAMGWHYNPLNPKACLQFEDTTLEGSNEGENGFHRTRLMILVKILAFPIMVTATIIFFLACFSMFLFPLFLVPLLMLMIVWTPCAMIIYFCLLPLGADERHLNYLVAVPFATFMSEVDMVCALLRSYEDDDKEDDGEDGDLERGEPF